MAEAWRARVRVSGYIDCSQQAWDRSEVGLWYGAWTIDDWTEAGIVSPKNRWSYLQSLPAHNKLGWDKWLPSLASIERFMKIPEGDWVVMYLPLHQELAMGQVYGETKSDKNHPLNTNAEIFKYRKIKNKKKFRIAALPDAYRILPNQGRQGNFHRFHAMIDHVNLLIESESESALVDRLNSKSNSEMVDFLGPSAWESFCFAYLILEKNFVPTGLSVGRTLRTADIVGRDAESGRRIIAQCKKNSTQATIEQDFIDLGVEGDNTDYFYFAFGGCCGVAPSHVKVVDMGGVDGWLKTLKGLSYLKIFRNE